MTFSVEGGCTDVRGDFVHMWDTGNSKSKKTDN